MRLELTSSRETLFCLSYRRTSWMNPDPSCDLSLLRSNRIMKRIESIKKFACLFPRKPNPPPLAAVSGCRACE